MRAAVLVVALLVHLDPSSSLAAPAAPGASKLLVVSAQSFRETCHADIDAARQRLGRFTAAAALSAKTDAIATLDEYDSAIALLNDAGARAGLARSVHPDASVREAASGCESDVEKANTELTLDRGVFDALQRLDVTGADAATRFYVWRLLRDFRRAGVDKDDDTRERIKALREKLVTLGQQFDDNIASDVHKIELDARDLDGLPDDYKRAHPPNSAGKVTLTTNNPDYQPFIAYATSPPARAAVWKLYRQRGYPKNDEVLKRILEARQQLAQLLGYSTWADYITGDKMIGTRQNAADFIQRIIRASEAQMNADYAAVLKRRQRDVPGATDVDAWDNGYYQEKVKAETYSFDSQSVRPYFEYSRVKAGVLEISSRMYGITFRPVSDAVVWHADVETYDVLDGNTMLGRIYLDMFPRENKYKHYATFQLTGGKAERTLPEGVLVCNFPRSGTEPALMEHANVETFFHEFGHLLHHVLGGRTQWAGLSGFATEFDFVEAPSQMFEEWAWTPDTLQLFARHYQTGEPIPTDLIKRMRQADEFGKGLAVRQQMFYATLSLQLHTVDARSVDVSKMVASLQQAITPYRFVENTHFETSFGHLNGYSAIYYTYMWSQVIAKDMFSVFKREGLLNRDVASRYRTKVLQPGGSQPAAMLVEGFLGRPFGFEAYEEWLNAK